VTAARSLTHSADPAVERLAERVRDARSVVALTGAGISVPSGIPDFRTPRTGLWANVDPMEIAHIDAFHSDAVRFWEFYGERFATLGEKLPNGAHRALVELEQRGLLDGARRAEAGRRAVRRAARRRRAGACARALRGG
jgi:NAD-dependent deacetylase